MGTTIIIFLGFLDALYHNMYHIKDPIHFQLLWSYNMVNIGSEKLCLITLVVQSQYLQFQDLGPIFYVSMTLLPQETKEGMKTQLSQSAREKQENQRKFISINNNLKSILMKTFLTSNH